MPRLRRYPVPALLLLPIIFVCGKLLLTPVPTVTPPDLRRLATYIPVWKRHEVGWPLIYSLALEGGSAEFFSVPRLCADCLVLFGIFAVSGAVIVLICKKRGTQGVTFSIRGLLIAIAILSAGFGWWFSSVRDYRRVTDITEGHWPNRSAMSLYCDEWQYVGPQWLERMLPDELIKIFRRPTELAISFEDESNAAEDIAALLSELPHIRQLILGKHRIAILGDLIGRHALDRIEEIDVTDDQAFDNEIKCLSQIPHLRRFGIFSNTQGPPKTPIFGDALKYLQDCHSLEQLTIHRGWMSDKEFGNLPAIPTLKGLWLSSALTTGACVDTILKQRNLEALIYSPNHPTEEEVRQIFALPKLRAFWCGIGSPALNSRLGLPGRFPSYEWVRDRFVQDATRSN